MLRHLLRAMKPCFAQQKNVFTPTPFYNIPRHVMTQVQEQVMASPSCKVLSVLLRENMEIFTDKHLGYLFQQLSGYGLVIDQSFHSTIVPITLEFVKTYNRQNAESLFAIAECLAHLNIQNDALWSLVLKKLDQENIYRYMNLKETANLYRQLAIHGKYINHSLFKKLEKVIHQQKAWYLAHPDCVQMIQTAVETLEKSKKVEKPLQINESQRQIV